MRPTDFSNFKTLDLASRQCLTELHYYGYPVRVSKYDDFLLERQIRGFFEKFTSNSSWSMVGQPTQIWALPRGSLVASGVAVSR